MNNKKFTLIELIVVIAILGILASLVVPNISSFKGDATVVAITSNVRNFQTSVDMYSLKNNGEYPTANQPTEFIPQPIDFSKLDRTYMKTKSKTDGVKYWIDFQGRVWASTIDAPQKVINTGGTITWETVEGATKYQVFELQGYQGGIGALAQSKTNLVLKGEVATNSYVGETNKYYVVNAVDEQNFHSAPAGLNYRGYVEPTQQSGGGNQTPVQVNHKPIAIITMTPETNITTTTTITWGHSSTDEDGDVISIAEWTLNGSVVQSLPTTFSAGTYTVGLKVKDSKGLESDVVTKQFTVSQPNQLSELQLGQYVKYGKFNRYDLTWQVVKKADGDVMLFMIEPLKNTDGTYFSKSFDVRPNAEEINDSDRNTYGSNNYYYSDIRTWLNNDFYNTAFTNKDIIRDTTHDYILANRDLAQATSGNVSHVYETIFSSSLQNYDRAYKKSVVDKVYLVNIKELTQNIKPTISSTYYNSSYWYWTRDSYAPYSYSARYVDTYGNIVNREVNTGGRVRPALNLKSAIFKSGNGTLLTPYIIE